MPATPHGPAPAKVWLQALRAYSLPASLVPVVFGVAYAGASGVAIPWWGLPVVLLGGVLAHLGTNLINDAVDYEQGVDTAETAGGSGVLVAGWLSSRQVRLAAYVAFAAAAAVGVALVALRGWPLLAIGAAGLVGGYCYTAPPLMLKYRRLGEPVVFLLMGPLMVAGAALAAAGAMPAGIWAASLPIGFMVTAILAANNLRDRDDDLARGVRTLTNLLGWRGGQIEVLVLLWATYVSLPVLWAVGALGPYCLVALAATPLAARLSVQVWRATPERFPPQLVERIAQLHLATGVLLSAEPIVRWIQA